MKGIDYPGVSVVFLCHDGNGRYLLSKRSANCRDEHGTWDGGAGGLELHDTIEETLRKEINEEFCTDPEEIEFLGYRDVHRVHADQKTHWIALDFKVRIDPEKAGNGEPHKFDEMGWFRMENLPKPMHSQWPVFYEKYKDKL